MHFAHFDIILFCIRVLTKVRTADPRKRKLNLTVFTLVSWLLSLAILQLLTQGRLSRINAWLGGAVWLMELALFVPAVIFVTGRWLMAFAVVFFYGTWYLVDCFCDYVKSSMPRKVQEVEYCCRAWIFFKRKSTFANSACFKYKGCIGCK